MRKIPLVEVGVQTTLREDEKRGDKLEDIG